MGIIGGIIDLGIAAKHKSDNKKTLEALVAVMPKVMVKAKVRKDASGKTYRDASGRGVLDIIDNSSNDFGFYVTTGELLAKYGIADYKNNKISGTFARLLSEGNKELFQDLLGGAHPIMIADYSYGELYSFYGGVVQTSSADSVIGKTLYKPLNNLAAAAGISLPAYTFSSKYDNI